MIGRQLGGRLLRRAGRGVPARRSKQALLRCTHSFQHKYLDSDVAFDAPSNLQRDVIIVGGGHNGLTTAAYLAKQGLDVLVLERRHLVGGAAVTEEIVPGFKFSRASYLAGLFRPFIIEELGLEDHGFEYLPRDPSSFTPTPMGAPHNGKYLVLGADEGVTWDSIAQFSPRDADAFFEYEGFLGKVRDILKPLLDGPPPDITQGNPRERLSAAKQLGQLMQNGFKHRGELVPLYELLSGPAAQILDRWFESDILKVTLACDAVIGAMTSPYHAGSGYVLLHHVVGEAAGRQGVWAYSRGGMGTISNSIARAAEKHGAEIATNATVREITSAGGRATGVVMDDGTRITASQAVISGANPYHTFLELCPQSELPPDFKAHVRHTDYSCGAMKINCAVDSLPNFLCCPNSPDGKPGMQHRGTIHFETSMQELDGAYRQASAGIPATRPIVEMTIPSSLDDTLAPAGKHVVQFFIQYAPYDLAPGVGSWADDVFKNAFADRCFAIVDEYCPGFSDSVIARDIVTPLDLEQIFGLPKGNIMSGGGMTLSQLGYARPVPGYSNYRTPLQGLYMAGAGTHPGGGVSGAPGRNCAMAVLSDLQPLGSFLV